jgi:glycerophosphoryl diester phosphodiesterase
MQLREVMGMWPEMSSRSIAIAFALSIGLQLAVVQPASALVPCPTLIAHRGNTTGAIPIENSLDGFTASFNAGSQWVESDMQFTNDSVPVLMHDYSVDRTTTGTGLVASMTGAQFTSLTMDDGQRPPTLDQALEIVRADPSRHMIMELKGPVSVTQESIVLGKLQGLESQIYVNGFIGRLTVMQHLKAADPLLTISLATTDPVLPVPVGISGEDMNYVYITAENVAQLHAEGAVVRAWVSNTPADWIALRDKGVDAIMTNYAVSYKQWADTTCVVNPDPVITTEDVTQVEAIPFQRVNIDDPALPIGTNVVTQQGVDGSRTVVYTVTYTDGVETSRVVQSTDVTVPAVDQVTHVGTMQSVPTTKEFVANQSFETNLNGWTGVSTGTSKNTRVGGGYSGDYALRSVNNSRAVATNGFISKPYWIDGHTNSTKTGTPYTASAWVKPDFVGQSIRIFLRETNPTSGAVISSKSVVLTATNTGWQRITNQYTARGSGNALAFHVYATNSGAQKGFLADLMSLTALN